MSEHDDPAASLMRLLWGYTTTGLTVAALRLGLPDRLADRTRTTAELAAETGSHEPSLNRLLRALAAIGLVDEVEPGRYRLSAVGALLRTAGAGSMYAVARVSTDATVVDGWRDLDHSVRTGQPVFDREYGTDFWTHLARDPELSALFNASMGEGTQDTANAIAKHYDFSRFATVVDVGGGNGTLLASILAAEPAVRGIVFDNPQGVAEAPAELRAAGVADRCEVRAGDFFTDVPAGGDLYLLKNILHDWDDERAALILANCRRAVPDGGRVLLVESVLPARVDPAGPPDAYLMDINMLVNFGGRERTEAEFHALLSAAGFTPSPAVQVGDGEDFLIEGRAPQEAR
ncbi:methyltransferase [Labedaea rhizosphaerae]|uniref:O-methyltransferase n=1 Tax=Labedaea rhizosphaerae TaxID=598644 RepID=A0A4R6RUK5_LABRH|nr:methyltransferase [Labedaea rhizosphaerae]TDP90590.1 O-methyltransferase [Labedaea rhizosphaerae]